MATASSDLPRKTRRDQLYVCHRCRAEFLSRGEAARHAEKCGAGFFLWPPPGRWRRDEYIFEEVTKG
jgi:hypothetical protein